MPDSDRFQKYTAGLIAAILVLLTLAVGYSKESEQDSERGKTAATNSGQSINQFGTPRAGIPAIAEAVISNPEPEKSNEREKRDLAAQESMAVWGFWTTFTAFGTMFITLCGTALIWRQVSLTREAVEDTGKATKAMLRQNELAEAAQRPWLLVKEVIFDSTTFQTGDIGGRSFMPFIRIVIRNAGQSPSRPAIVDFAFAPSEPCEIDFYQDAGIGNGEYVDILPPGEEQTIPMFAIYNALEIFGPDKGNCQLYIRIRYKSFMNEMPHNYVQQRHFGLKNFRGTMQPYPRDVIDHSETIDMPGESRPIATIVAT